MSDHILPKTFVPPNSTVDDNLRSRVRRYLESQQRMSFRRLKIDARDGVITVQGTLDSFHGRQVVVACIRRVAGVQRVVDRIEVSASPR